MHHAHHIIFPTPNTINIVRVYCLQVTYPPAGTQVISLLLSVLVSIKQDVTPFAHQKLGRLLHMTGARLP